MVSPKLFDIDADVLGQQLDEAMVELYLNGKAINYLYYADDLVVLSPSVHGMQKFVHECENVLLHMELHLMKSSAILNFKRK